ncbi:hypothetical protein E2C01_048065 [Portunus trituberculatus]|uniref:Endonuclease/exonuclease/phosphatase domain-containing protein n=1 Tax=Portunus trituberculatus TaxID=210409 RepID=A0A5B7G9L1_PORTR|nr:hypothetical protein [Portunus trituberculatus]
MKITGSDYLLLTPLSPRLIISKRFSQRARPLPTRDEWMKSRTPRSRIARPLLPRQREVFHLRSSSLCLALLCLILLLFVTLPPSGLLPLAPKDTYVKLQFNRDPSTDTKLRWLSTITKTFHLQRELAEVKMAAVTSRFVYISRQLSDIIDRVKTGFTCERPKKFPSYILTRYPVNVDPNLATSYPGVYSARRFIQDGAPIARIVVGSLPDPPPPVIYFDFLPCLPPCEVCKLLNDRPTCFRCWGIGHISRYCSSLPKCAWCAAGHDSRTCPTRREAPHAGSSVASVPLPPGDTSQWKCPCCLQPGVNVWYGCARRRVSPPPPPLPSSPSSVQAGASSTASSSDLDLRKSVASLMARCATLEDRFTALEGRIDFQPTFSCLNPSGLLYLDIKFTVDLQLHVLSWNICSVTSPGRLAQLKGYIYKNQPNIIFLQEVFSGRPLPTGQAPPLAGYIPYVHLVRNGLLTYIHYFLPHRLPQTSTDPDITFQLFEVSHGYGVLKLWNVYSAPARLTLQALNPPTVRGFVYMGDFNARHPDLGDPSPSCNHNGPRLLAYIGRHRLTRWDTGGATHSRGATLDYILTAGLVSSRVQCSTMPSLFSDHVALRLMYSLSTIFSPPSSRLRIVVPPKYCPIYITFMTQMLYVSRPHIQARHATHSWVLDARIQDAKEDAERDGLQFQANQTPELLCRYQASRDTLVALQKCAITSSWTTLTSRRVWLHVAPSDGSLRGLLPLPNITPPC